MANLSAAAKYLLDAIGAEEAPNGYDTVYHNRMERMPKPLTSMTVDEAIKQGKWRYENFGSSACGRYQFMQATLSNLKEKLHLTGSEKLTPAFQDMLGMKLLRDRGYDRFVAGRITIPDFAKQLAMEWASFPVLEPTKGHKRNVSRGQSFYAGDGLNKALISADEVEDVLANVLKLAGISPEDKLAVKPDPAISAPTVRTASPAGSSKLSTVAGWLRGKAKPPVTALRPGLKPGGDPALWDVQDRLRELSYYTKGKPDGFDGPLTQEAVAQARKDNGLGDGGVDDEFLAALAGMPQRPVSIERLSMPVTEAAKQRPEVFNPVKWMLGLGLGSTGLGTINGSGLLDNIQTATSKANDTLGSVQTAIGTVSSMVGFVIEHKSWFLIGLGLYVTLRALSFGLDGWIKVRKAFF